MIKPNYILLSAMLLTLAACGGSSSNTSITPDPDPDPDPSPTASGTVADGYLSGAIVCLDLNNNKACETDEPQTVSDIDGKFTIEATQAQIDSASIVAIITETTIDSDNPGVPVENPYVLSSPAGQTFVSPISTVVHHLLETNPQFDLVDAVNEAHEKLGIAQSVELLEDYIESGDTDAHHVAQDIAEVLGLELEDAQTLVDANQNLNDGDFPNVFAVVIDRIVENAAAISQAGDDIRENGGVGSISGDIIQITDLEQEVQLQELDHNLAVASFEDTVTQPFHRVGGDNDCDHGPLQSESGSECLEQQFPVVKRETIQVNAEEGTVGFSSFKYDFEQKAWQSEPGENNDHSKIVLGASGWEALNEANQTVAFNEDGTATLTNGPVQEKLSISLADLSGLPLFLVLEDDDEDHGPAPEPIDGGSAQGGHNPEDDRFDAFFDQAAQGVVFAQGSTGIRFASEKMTDVYELFQFNDSFQDCAIYNGNCNVVEGGLGSVTDINTVFVAADSMVGETYPRLQTQRGFIQLVETGTEGGTSGVARLVRHPDYQGPFPEVNPGNPSEGGEPTEPPFIDPSASCADRADCNEVTWLKKMVNGVDMIVIDIPADQREAFDIRDGTALILAEQNGFVRRGSFQPAGTREDDEDLMFNDAALETADEFLAAVADLIAESQQQLPL